MHSLKGLLANSEDIESYKSGYQGETEPIAINSGVV